MIEPTGYTALDLIGFTDRGEYDPDAYYVKNDITTVGNTKWRCLIDDTHNITPTEGANWTIYLESATSLAGMDDVTLTSPKNGDGLVHDGNDWKNIPIMTKEQWKKNGAYNLLPNEGSTQVSYGLTFTFNPTGYKKGVVHVTGTKSDSDSHGINLSGVFNLKAGTYKILDGLSNNNLGIALIDNSTSTFILQTYNQHEATFTLAADTEVRCTIVFLGAQNTTFDDYIYPMITTDLNATPADYEPFAKTNRELTEETSIKFYDLSSAKGTNVTFLSASAVKLGDMVFLQGHWIGSNNSSEPILTVPQELNPKATKVYGYGMAKFSTGYVAGEYSLKNTAGNLYQSISSSAGTEGEFSVIYSISKSTT